MFQNRALINSSSFCFLTHAIFCRPDFVLCVSPTYLWIFKIRNFFIQNIYITRLVHIQFCCHKRPERVIHPYSCNVVAICYKFTWLVSNNSCICSIKPYTLETIQNHGTDFFRIKNQKRQAILPQISPSSATSSVIMIRQERTSVNSS